MLFNSIPFAFFLPIVFFVYWALARRPLVWQNLFLLISSYFFYAWWDWRFLGLLILSSSVDFVTGRMIAASNHERRRKGLLLISLGVNLGVLGFFKYFDFFIASMAELLEFAGLRPNLPVLNLILPVGVSFYTFQTLTYTIDIYRRKIEPTSDAATFFAYVGFFPQLVAGPIERASSLLPQFLAPRVLDWEQAKDGLRRILWGLVKKVCIADVIGSHVDHAFANHASLDGAWLAAGAILFAIQIYCDFSGYSDIAIGVARLFGFRLRQNFRFPYFSRDLVEFWRRWHISLSTWFRDYLYLPLGGSFVSRPKFYFNVMLTFTLSGLWHGANWTFIAWGVIHGLAYLFGRSLAGTKRQMNDIPVIRDLPYILVTFGVSTLAWVFFRSPDIETAIDYLVRLFSEWSLPSTTGPNRLPLGSLAAALALLGIEWTQRDKEHALQIEGLPVQFRWLTYYSLTGWVIFSFFPVYKPFIYFQF